MNHKRCGKCGDVKQIDEFSPRGDGIRGVRSECKECRKHRWASFNKNNPDKIRKSSRAHYRRNIVAERARSSTWNKENPDSVINARLLREFKITLADYQAMLSAQHGVCKICKLPERAVEPIKNRPKNLTVDHCHKTGRIRGLLCTRCNSAIGHLLDDPIRAEKLAAYIRNMVIPSAFQCDTTAGVPVKRIQ